MGAAARGDGAGVELRPVRQPQASGLRETTPRAGGSGARVTQSDGSAQSRRAQAFLTNFEEAQKRFWKVLPKTLVKKPEAPVATKA